MNGLQTQMLLLDSATALVQFAANWFLQSALLIAIGLAMGRLLAVRGSAVQSAVYRTTLAAVLVCPIASLLLSLSGVSGWSLSMPQPWTYAEVEPAAADVPAPQAALPSPTLVAQPALPAPEPTIGYQPQPRAAAGEQMPQVDTGPALADRPLPTVPEEPIAEPAAPRIAPAAFSFSIHVFGWIALGLSAAWLLISAILAGGLCLAWWRLSRLRRGALPADDATRQACRELAVQLGVAPPPVLRSPYLPSPCLAGIRRPIVLLPEAALSLSTRDVLIHELAHLHRRDCHWNLLRHVALSTLFFQPLLWMLSRRLEATAEEVCDDFVVQLGGDRQEYAHRLIDVAELSTAPMAAAGVGIVSLRSMLARRVVRIMDTSRSLSTRASSLLLALVVVGGLVGTVVVGLVGIGPRRSVAEATDDTVASTRDDQKTDGATVVSGQVMLSDGKPAAGAQVAVIAASVQPARRGERLQPGEALAEGIADDAGHYRLSIKGFSSKTHVHANVIARKEGYAIAWQEFNIDAPATAAALTLSAQQPIRGRLVDIEGQPAVGVRLLIQAVSRTKPGQNMPARTADGGRSEGVYYHRGDNFPPAWIAPVVSDAQGRFALDGIPAGHGVSLTAEGNDRFAPQEIAINTGMAEVGGEPGFAYQPYWPLVRNMAAGEEALLPLAPAQWFEGLVTYEDTGQPIPHAQLTIWAHQKKENGGFSGVSGKADAQGRYRINPSPGILFHIDTYPPDGTPYFARQFGSNELILWQAGDRVKQVNLKLPRGVLARGTIVEAGTKTPVAGATVQYFPESTTTARAPAGDGHVLTDGSAAQLSNENGEFAIAVLPGPGRLLVRAAQDKYIFYETSERELSDGSPGGKRNYAHAIERIDPVAGAAPIELSVPLRPAATVAGSIVDEAGKKLDQARVISNLQVWPGVFYWLADSTPPTLGGRFELSGLAPDRDYSVYFLEPGRQLGARREFRADTKDPTVVLKPCGQATARLVDDKGRPRAGIAPYLHMIVTPGAWPVAPSAISAGIDALVNKVVAPDEMQYDMAAGRLGRLAADGDYLANIDPTNYLVGPASDEQGRVTFPALIPGATYQLHGYYNNKILKEFSVKSGEQLDLGNIEYAGGKPRAAQQMQAAVSADQAPDGNPPANRNAAAADDEPIVTAGRVLDSAGKPVAGATVRLVRWFWDKAFEHQPLAETASGPDGAFKISYRKSQFNVDVARPEQWKEVAVSAFKQGYGPDWAWRNKMPVGEPVELRLPVDDVAITGRLVDLEGRPLAGVRVACGNLLAPKGDDLSAWIEAVRLGETPSSAQQHWRESLTAEGTGLARDVVTDRDGRFRLAGIGRERLLDLVFEGPSIARSLVRVATRKMPPLAQNRSKDPTANEKISVQGADFELALPPTRVIEGVVRDAKTGQVVSGVGIESWRFSGSLFVDQRHLRTVSDDTGHFRLVGMPKGPGNEIIAIPGDRQPYLMRVVKVPDKPGIEPAQAEVELHRGIWITGRVTDLVTGEPIPMAWLSYSPFLTNEFAGALPEFDSDGNVDGTSAYQGRYQTAADGSYRLLGLPGRAIIGVQVVGGQYSRGQGAADIQGIDPNGRFPTWRNPINPGNKWPTAMKEINPAESADSVELDFALDPGRQIEITALDPAGQPLAGVTVIGLNAGGGQQTLEASTFLATSLGSAEERTILLHHEKLGLGKVVRVRADDPRKKVTVQLAPCAKILGRLVDANQTPITGAEIRFGVLPGGDFSRSLESAATDADGRFQHSAVLPGASYGVLAEGKQIGFKVVAKEVAVSPGETVDLGTIDVTADERPEPVRTKAATGLSDQAAEDNLPITIPGRVVDTTGEPVAGATVRLVRAYWDLGIEHKPLAETTSDNAGRFEISYRKSQFDVDVKNFEQWKHVRVVAFKAGYGPDCVSDGRQSQQREVELRLATDDLPITGRLVDLEGRPLAGVTVECHHVQIPRTGKLDDWIEAVKRGEFWAKLIGLMRRVPPEGTGLVPVITDADGRFRLNGVGHERTVDLVFSGPAVARTPVIVATRPLTPLAQAKVKSSQSSEKIPVLGADFQLSMAPTRVVQGIVRDAESGLPLPGVKIESWHFSGAAYTGSFERHLRVASDAQGRFRLVGMAKGPENQIIALPSDDQPYLMRVFKVPDPAGLEPVEIELDLHRGIWISGRVTDAQSGQAVPMAAVVYLPFHSNPYAQALPEFPKGLASIDGFYDRYQTAADGSYRLVGLPGPAIVGVLAEEKIFAMGQGAGDIHGPTDERGQFLTYRQMRWPDKEWPTAMTEINPSKPTAVEDSVEGLDFVLARRAPELAVPEPAAAATAASNQPETIDMAEKTIVTGSVTLPDGKPAAGADVAIIALRTNHGRGGDLAPRGVVLAEGRTDDAGSYRLSFPAASAQTNRDAHLIARCDGFALAAQAVNLDADSSDVAGLALRPEDPIVGRLVDIEGKPAAGVRLIVKALSKESAAETDSKTSISYQTDGENIPAAWLAPVVSDAEGRFSVRGVPVGQGVLSSIATEQFAPQSLALNTGAAEQRGERDGTYRSQVKNAKPTEELILPLAPAQWFEGQITFEDTGLPAPHARLTIWASQQEQFGSMVSVPGQADADGRYRVCPMPGVRFGINAYPPAETPYLARQTPISQGILWKAGDRVKQVDMKLPRGVLVRGKVVEAGTDKPVAGASIQYVPEESNNPNVADDILTGWQAIQLSDERGEFALAVLPGPGRLLVHGQGNFVFQQTSEEELRRGQPGGRRTYAHAVARIEPSAGAEPLDLTLSLQPGVMITGELVDEQNARIDEALVLSRLDVSPLHSSWRSLKGPQPGGKFQLSGLGPDQEYPVYFLDPHRRLGATEVFRSGSVNHQVVLKPCGTARARYVNLKGEPLVKFDPIIRMIVTPGVDAYDWEAAKLGKLAADEDGLANIDRTNYWSPRVMTDEQGQITFPALIPGATYRLYKLEGGKIRSFKDFSVASGEQLELGEFSLDAKQ